jgi:hypothetical protein
MTAAALVLTVSGAWAVWDTGPARAVRRAVGLAVPPLSPLYLAVGGGLLILDGAGTRVVAGNPAMAVGIAVSTDLGVRTLAGLPPWTGGAAFGLDGTPVAGPRASADGICCFYDGATDGEFNYAVRQDSTLLEPIGSRPLAPRELYRFSRDWSDPQALFPLTQAGYYSGVSYSKATGTFWMARNDGGVAVLEQWNREGRLVSSPVQTLAPLTGVACDQRDGTIWVMRQLPSAREVRLDNYDASGRRLGTYRVSHPLPFLDAGGAEFVWSNPR